MTGSTGQFVEQIRWRGLDCVRLRSGGSCVVISRFGAQVLSWITANGRERLFLSERAILDRSTAIRGGIPICFPQFSGLGSLSKHGLVRTREWQVAEPAQVASPGVHLEFRDDAQTRAVWPHQFELALDVEAGATSLTLRLSVRNCGSDAFSFTGALHSYLAVADLAEVRVIGLTGSTYRDAAGGNAIRAEREPEVRFGTEVDRVYHDAPRRVLLRGAGSGLAVEAEGFPDTVVWNPGATLCAGLPDMAPDGYLRMVCVEAAVARQPVTVMPGDVWCGSQTLSET